MLQLWYRTRSLNYQIHLCSLAALVCLSKLFQPLGFFKTVLQVQAACHVLEQRPHPGLSVNVVVRLHAFSFSAIMFWKSSLCFSDSLPALQCESFTSCVHLRHTASPSWQMNDSSIFCSAENLSCSEVLPDWTLRPFTCSHRIAFDRQHESDTCSSLSFQR